MLPRWAGPSCLQSRMRRTIGHGSAGNIRIIRDKIDLRYLQSKGRVMRSKNIYENFRYICDNSRSAEGKKTMSDDVFSQDFKIRVKSKLNFWGRHFVESPSGRDIWRESKIKSVVKSASEIIDY